MAHAAAEAIHSRTRAITLVVGLTVVGAVLAGLIVASSGDARARATCFGKTATIVGTNSRDVIGGTEGKDVIAARGGNDVIRSNSNRTNHGKDIVCGGSGDDKITGNNEQNTLIGDQGNDEIKGGPGDDLIVGDNADPKGAESGKTGRDDLNGAVGRDFVVGDNYALGNATGASPDEDVMGLDNGDKVIGDSASITGNATGGATDRVAGADGNDLVVGDSFAPHGTASGAGDDKGTRINPKAGINAGPGNDVAVGDNYTNTGRALGGGSDELQSADGGDAGAKCKPHTCDDVFYGDSYAAACGPRGTTAVIHCQANHTEGGGVDRISTDQGNDLLNGGAPDDPKLRGNGDKCAGGSGRDAAARCEFDRDVESEVRYP